MPGTMAEKSVLMFLMGTPSTRQSTWDSLMSAPVDWFCSLRISNGG